MIWDVTSDIWNTTTQTWSGIVIAGITYDSDLLTKFSTEVRTFDDLCDEFQDSVNAVVFLDLLTSGQPAIVGAEFQGTGQTIYGVATNSSFDFFLPIILNLSSGVFAFLNDCGSFT